MYFSGINHAYFALRTTVIPNVVQLVSPFIDWNAVLVLLIVQGETVPHSS